MKKMKTNQIIHGDCIQVMKNIPNNSIDLILTDPPYGDNIGYGLRNKKIANNQNPLINCLALVECYRVLKKNKCVYNFTNWKNYPFLTEFILRYTNFKLKHIIVWNKHNFGLGWAFRNQFELILVLEKGKPKYNLNNFADVQNAKAIIHTEDSHPHQKPIDLLMKIIEHSSKERDIILDPFCGSGSICLAAQMKKRKWIGIELDEGYVKMARNRINGNV
jgi:site-specific DNA-methyltransferase (adenine-specific)